MKGLEEERKKNLIFFVQCSSRPTERRVISCRGRAITIVKCTKMKNARAKHAKQLLFIVKYANLRNFCRRRHCVCLGILKSSRDVLGNWNCSTIQKLFEKRKWVLPITFKHLKRRYLHFIRHFCNIKIPLARVCLVFVSASAILFVVQF